MATALRVLVADDHTLLRRGLISLLRDQSAVKVVGEAANGAEAVEQVRRLAPDVVLMDCRMPGLDGVAATRIITAECPQTRVVVLTVSDADDDLLEAVTAGAKGYLLKSAEIEDVVRAIEAAAADEVVLSPRMAAKMLGLIRGQAGGAVLSGDAGGGLTGRKTGILGLLEQRAPRKAVTAAVAGEKSRVRNRVHSLLDSLQSNEQLPSVGAGRPTEASARAWSVATNILSPRETQVLELLAKGASTGEVADALIISRATARHHINSILAKLGVHSRLEAVAAALGQRQGGVF